jgi:hypothetical protein
MQVIISETPWAKTLIGLAKQHDPALTYGAEIQAALGPVWEAVRRNKTLVTGINHVLYGAEGELFCGLECSGEPVDVPGLVLRQIEICRYAYLRHTGPYEQIPQAYAALEAEIKRLGLHPKPPSLEIYGHWNANPNLLETEILQTVA